MNIARLAKIVLLVAVAISLLGAIAHYGFEWAKADTQHKKFPNAYAGIGGFGGGPRLTSQTPFIDIPLDCETATDYVVYLLNTHTPQLWGKIYRTLYDAMLPVVTVSLVEPADNVVYVNSGGKLPIEWESNYAGLKSDYIWKIKFELIDKNLTLGKEAGHKILREQTPIFTQQDVITISTNATPAPTLKEETPNKSPHTLYINLKLDQNTTHYPKDNLPKFTKGNFKIGIFVSGNIKQQCKKYELFCFQNPRVATAISEKTITIVEEAPQTTPQ